MHSISIVIPNYNGRSLLQKNIPDVVRAVLYYKSKKETSVEIIIVDDGSLDDSLAVLEELKKTYDSKLPFYVFKNKKNLGFSSTVNKGVKEASRELVVLLNTDVKPSEEFLLPLVDHFNDDKIFGVGCLDRSIEGDKVVERGRGIGYWRQGILIHSAGQLDKTTTLWVSGGSGMFRKSIWDQLGGCNELMDPFYWEDIDLSYRAQKMGYTVRFEKGSVVTHKHEEGAIKRTASKNRVRTTAFRNQYIFTWTNLTDSDLLIAHIIFLPYHVIKALLRLDFQYLSGFFQALIMFPAILSYRKKVIRHMTQTDKSLQLLS